MPLPDQPKDTPIPAHLKRWNWGAFLLNWIWGLGNSTYIALLMFVPLVNIVMLFVLGARGSEWAWKNRLWSSEADFMRTQRNWARAGLIVIVLVIGAAYLFFNAFRDNQAYQDSLNALRNSPEAIAALGAPIEDGMMMQGNIQLYGGGGGDARFIIPVSGPKCSGKLFSRAEKKNGAWTVFLLVLETECAPGVIVLINQRGFNIPGAAPAITL